MRLPGGAGIWVLGGSVFTRVLVLLMICTFAFWTEYSNLKLGYNNPRLVELAHGPTVRVLYETTDRVLSWFGDPAEIVRLNAGMPWAVRLAGVPFIDPLAAVSLLARAQPWTLGFGLGLLVPIGLALVFGRVFCSYICPASLGFFVIRRLRRFLSRFFYFPEVSNPRPVAWGVLVGGLILAAVYGHGVWAFILPYLAAGQTVFQGAAFGVLSPVVFALLFFGLADLILGNSFTCRTLCPTGRWLGTIGRKPLISVRRDASRCLAACNSCEAICPFQVSPKQDRIQDCSICGECLVACPTSCLSIGRQA